MSGMFYLAEKKYTKEKETTYSIGYNQGVNDTSFFFITQLMKLAENCDYIPVKLNDGTQLNLIAIECLQSK